MQTLGVDNNNNLIIKQTSLVIKDGIEAYAQDLKTRIGLNARENPFDLSEGIDYDVDVLGKSGGKNYLKQMIRQRILSFEGTDNIGSLTVEQVGDNVTLVAEVESTYGKVSL